MLKKKKKKIFYFYSLLGVQLRQYEIDTLESIFKWNLITQWREWYVYLQLFVNEMGKQMLASKKRISPQ